MIVEVSVDGRQSIRLTLENENDLPVVLEKLAEAVRRYGFAGTMEVMELNGCRVSAEPIREL